MPITSYPYTEADRPRLRDFMLRLWASGAPGCWHIGDLAWGLFLMSIRLDLARHVRVWAEEAGLLGFAWFDPGDCSLLMQVQPDAHQAEVAEQMLAWALACRAESLRAAPPGQPPPLLTGAFADDPARSAWLERHGFVCRAAAYLQFRRSLAGPLPAPEVPPGFAVRPLAGVAEIPRRAAAHRAAFHPSRVTDEHYHRLWQMPEYTPELDVVAVDTDGAQGALGTVGAFCLGWPDPVNKIAEFEPVGTAPAYQRRGLAKAVLLEGLRRMQAMGMETAFVCTNAPNLAARQLYQAVGFTLTNTDFDYVYLPKGPEPC